jgi:hypothetical protein
MRKLIILEKVAPHRKKTPQKNTGKKVQRKKVAPHRNSTPEQQFNLTGSFLSKSYKQLPETFGIIVATSKMSRARSLDVFQFFQIGSSPPEVL